ncbi:MAG: Ig-like domain-containing protein, partial [Dermatophilaceae bacterium]
GVVYEGRWSGTTSTSCVTAKGDGSDFGHEDSATDRMVTGGHTGGYNSGNMGVALLGEFTDHRRFGADPTPAAVGGLEDVLTELSTRHLLDPTGTVSYVNPVNGDTLTVDTISGHRDWNATECPGDRLYAQLPTIRTNVKAAMESGDGGGSTDEAPTVAVTSPTDGSTVSGPITLEAKADDDNGVAQVEFFVDDVSIGTTADSVDGTWSVPWDSTTVSDGSRTLTATATDSADQSTTSAPVTVTVENTDEPTALTVTGITPTTVRLGTTDMTLTGTGFTSGTTVSFENGKGAAPTVTVTSASETSISADVTVEARGPDSYWDVRVTLSDGSSAIAPQRVLVDR